MTSHDHALFEPTLQHRPQMADARRPWRLNSLFVVALLGGVGPYVALAILNARRLRATPIQLRALVALGVIGLVAVLLLHLWMPMVTPDGVDVEAMRTDAGRQVRIMRRVAAAVVAVGTTRILRSPFRAYELRSGGGDAFAPLPVPGIAAILIAGFLESAAMVAIAGVLGR